VAKGRMLNKKISLNKHLSQMSDFSALAYTWAIAHLDKNGVMHGDPCVFLSIVFPRRHDLDPDQVQNSIDEWAQAGLVHQYEAEGDTWLWFPKFVENQVGLRADREPDTGYPLPSGNLPDNIRQTSGNLPESIPPNRTEGNRTEINQTEDVRARKKAAASWPEGSLELATWFAFEKGYGTFMPDGSKQIDAINKLVFEARTRGDPKIILPKMMEKLLELKENDGTKHSFWRRQPFLPSTLVSLWARVWEEAKIDFQDQAEAEEVDDVDF